MNISFTKICLRKFLVTKENFESSLVEDLCTLTKVTELRTSPYCPQTNGEGEHYNAAVLPMLGTPPKHVKVYWQEQVLTLVCACNSIKWNATGFSPYFHLYGRHPMLRADVEFGVRTPDTESNSTQRCVERLYTRLNWTYKVTQKTIKKGQVWHRH